MNISSLQTILKREEESIRDFTMRFDQAVHQIESYSMDAVLQNFRRSFEPSTPLFQSLSLDPLVMSQKLIEFLVHFSYFSFNIIAYFYAEICIIYQISILQNLW